MSLSRIWKILRKDLALGPRSPIVLWAIVLPVMLTLILQFAFGSLFDPQPRLGIVDDDGSEVTRSALGMEGIEVTLLNDEAELREQVEANDLDAGLVLPAGFDAAVKAGERPALRLFIGGESHASSRVILTVTTIDLVRELEGDAAPVRVDVVDLGEAGLPISVRLVPVIVFYALVIAGLFVPASNLVEEKEHGTLVAILVTPVRSAEVLVAKWLFGLILASVMGVVALALNGAMGLNWLEVVLVVLVAAMLSAMLGIVVGVFSKDSAMMFGIVKGAGVFLFMPVAFYIFPDWPQWVAMLFPLYWIIEPIWQVSVMGEPFTTVLPEIGVALGLTAALGVLAWWLAKRVQAQMAAG